MRHLREKGRLALGREFGRGAALRVHLMGWPVLPPQRSYLVQAWAQGEVTLRYLLLVAALLSPRPPSLMILNEPETSLHPDLLPALSRLVPQRDRRYGATAVTILIAS